jgi:hypothetical protein
VLTAAGYNRNSTCLYKTLDGASADAKDPGNFFRGEQRRHLWANLTRGYSTVNIKKDGHSEAAGRISDTLRGHLRARAYTGHQLVPTCCIALD